MCRFSLVSQATAAPARLRLARVAFLLALLFWWQGPFETPLSAQPAPNLSVAGEPGINETVGEIMARTPLAPDLSVAPLDGSPLRKSARTVVQAPDAAFSATWPDRSLLVQAAEVAAMESPFTTGVSFDGAVYADSGKLPPDPMGAAGPSQFLVCVNGRIRVFSKAGARGALDTTTDNFFASLTSNRTSDPRVRYDRLSGRWFVVMVEVPGSRKNNKLLLAVSSGSVIATNSSFKFFSFQHNSASPSGDNNLFADYPTLGVDANALYIGVNLFNSSGTTFSGTSGFVVKKANLIAGSLAVTALRSLCTATGPGPYTPQGVDNDDPAATEGYFIGVDNITKGRLAVRRVLNPGGTTTVSANLNITVPATIDPLRSVPSKGAAVPLDALDDRLISARIQKGRLWTAHHIQVDATGTASATGGRIGARWYEITNLTATPSLRQSGTLFDGAAANPSSYWFPSCVVSGQGHMALGCSVAGPNEYAEIAVAGRLATDPLGFLSNPFIAQLSTTSYDVGTDNPRRWGDFSITSPDPNDNMTLWTVQEYGKTTNSWGVRVIQLKAPPPSAPLACDPPSVLPGASTVDVMVTGLSSGGSGFYDPGPGFTNRIAALVNAPGVTVNKVTYAGPTNLTLNLSLAASAPEGDVSLTVINPDGQRATSGTGILFVGVANKAPTISDITDLTVNEDTATPVLHFTVADKETPAGSLVVTGSSSNPAVVPQDRVVFGGAGADRTLVVTPAFNQFGSAVITVTVRDAGGKEAKDTFVLTVNPVNDPPTLDPLSDLTLDEDAPLQTVGLKGIGTGAANEAQGLTVRAASSNPALISNPSVTYHSPDATGQLTFLPMLNASGTAVITVTVDDGQVENHEARQTITVRVNPVNDPPRLSTIPDQVTNEDVPKGVPLLVSDLETPPDLLIVRAQSANPLLVPDKNVTVTGSGANRTLIITPATNQFGSVIITVTVRDPNGAEAAQSFLLTVNPVNDPPTVSEIPDQATAMNTPKQATFAIGDVETGPDQLILSGTSSDQGVVPDSGIVFGGTARERTVTVTPGAGQSGTTTISVNVNDPDGGAVTEKFELTVAANTPPTLTDLGDTAIDEDTLTVLTFTVGDAETAAEDLVVTASSPDGALVPPGNLMLAGEGGMRTLAVMPGTNAFGNAQIRVAVADGDGGITSQEFTLTVNPVDDLPTITDVHDQTIPENTAQVEYAITIGDVDTLLEDLSLVATSLNETLVLPENVTFTGTGASRKVVIRPQPEQSGTTLIVMVVVEDLGGFDSAAFALTVVPVNHPPRFDPGVEVIVQEDAGPQTLRNWASNISPGRASEASQALQFRVESEPTDLFVNGPALTPDGTLSFKTAAHVSGVATVSVTLQDDGGTEHGGQDTSPTQNFTITVQPVNHPPVLDPIADQWIVLGQPLRVPNVATDVDLPPDRLTFGLVEAPFGAEIDPMTGLFTWTPSALQSGSENLIQVMVTDDGVGKLSDTKTFRVFVTDPNQPPILGPIPDQTVHARALLRLTIPASDPDGPANALAFSLKDPPAGAAIESPGGVFSWTPTEEQLGTTEIVVQVNDAGVPSLGANGSFRVTVIPRPTVKISVAEGRVLLSWGAIEGKVYRVEYSDQPGGADWEPLQGDITAKGDEAQQEDTLDAATGRRFYRVLCLR